MKSTQVSSVYLVFLFLFIGSSLQMNAQKESKESWKLEKDKHGIKIYTRKQASRKVKEYLVVTTIDATPKEVMHVLRDVDNYTKWMALVKNSSLLSKEKGDSLFIYTESDSPWPASNRDVITRSWFHWEADTAIVDMKGYPEYIPEKEGIVRTRESSGCWRIEPLGNGSSYIRYNYYIDPAGNLPAWMVNLFIVDAPYKTLTGLKEYLSAGD